MSDWTLTSTADGITAQTLAALGVTRATLRLLTLDRDELTLTVPCNADGAALLTYGNTVSLAYGGTTIFIGRCDTLPRYASARQESIAYRIVGPWWYLDQCIYQQAWKVYSVGGSTWTTANKSRVVLCQKSDGTRWTSGQQIADAIDWAIARGAPIARSTIDPAVEVPWDEVREITCAEVIRRMLDWSPDALGYWDYSGATPTFLCRSRANATALSLALTDLESLEITPRYDLQLPGVRIVYEATHDLAGSIVETTSEDTAGSPNAIGALNATIELAGAHSGQMSQALETVAWPTDFTNAAGKTWWQANCPQLAGANIDSLTVASVTGTPLTYARYIVGGSVAAWMGVNTKEETVTAKVSYTVKDSGSATQDVERVISRIVSVTKMSTDGTTKTYRRQDGYTSPEPTPSGIAAAVYASWGTLQYDGTATLLEAEARTTIRPGLKLNLTGGLAAWSTMNAMVSEVIMDIASGRTTLRFGPLRHLHPDNLIALWRAIRRRQVAFGWLKRTTGKTEDQDGTVSNGSKDETNLAGAAEGERTYLQVLARTAGTIDGKYIIDPAAVKAASDYMPIQVQTLSAIKTTTIDWLRLV